MFWGLVTKPEMVSQGSLVQKFHNPALPETRSSFLFLPLGSDSRYGFGIREGSAVRQQGPCSRHLRWELAHGHVAAWWMEGNVWLKIEG